MILFLLSQDDFFPQLWFLNSVCIAPPSAFVLWRNCLKRNTLSGNYAFIEANILPSELVPVEWIGRFACLTLDTLKSFTKSGLMCTLNFPWLRRNSAAQKTCDLKPPCENLAVLWPVTKLTVVSVEPGWYLSCWVLRQISQEQKKPAVRSHPENEPCLVLEDLVF